MKMKRVQKSKGKKRKTKKPVRRFLDTLALCCGKCCQPKTTDTEDGGGNTEDKVSPTRTLPDLLSTQEEDPRMVQAEFQEEDQSAATLDRLSENRDGTDEEVAILAGQQSTSNKEVKFAMEKTSQKCLKCGDPRPLKVAMFVDFFGSVSFSEPVTHPERVTVVDVESETVSLSSTESTCMKSMIHCPWPCQKENASLDVAKEEEIAEKLRVNKYSSTLELLPKNVASFVDFHGKVDDKWLEENTEVAEIDKNSNKDCLASKSELLPKNVALFVNFIGAATDEKHSTQPKNNAKEDGAMDESSKADDMEEIGIVKAISEGIHASSKHEGEYRLDTQEQSSTVKAVKDADKSKSELLPKGFGKMTDIADNGVEDVDLSGRLELCASLSRLLPKSVVEFVGLARDDVNAAEQEVSLEKEVSLENIDIAESSTKHAQKHLSVEEGFCSETEIESGLEHSEIDSHEKIQDQDRIASVKETAEEGVGKDILKNGKKTKGVIVVKSEAEAHTESSSASKQSCKSKKNGKKKQRKKRSSKKRKGKSGGKKK